MKSVLIPGNPFVQQREGRGGEILTLRLVYKLERVFEIKDGEKVAHQPRKTEKLDLWLYAKPHTPQEREHNRQVKETAKNIREVREKEYLSKTRGYVFASDRNKINFYEWYEDYIKNYTKQDIRVIEQALSKWRRYIESTPKYNLFSRCIHPDQITQDMVKGFVERLECDCRGTGAQSTYKRFKKVLTAATREGVFIENPCEGIVARATDDGRLKKNVLTADEITRLVKCKFERQSDDVHRAFVFCLFTGLRFCDVKELRYKNIDYKERSLTFTQAKTGRENTIPLRDDLLKMVGRGDGESKIFVLPSANACNKALQHWVDRAGINKHITWHCGRHTFGANTYYNLKDLRATSELLGHTDIQMTQIYTQIFDERKREVVESLPQIEGIENA